MAKYDVTFSCGHTEEIQLFGKTEERNNKIKYFEEHGLCSSCYKKQQEEKREKAYEEALENQNVTLGDLEGSDKQIQWAETLRKKAFIYYAEKYDEAIKKVEIKINDLMNEGQEDQAYKLTNQLEETKSLFSQARDIVFGNLKAKFWIDNRDKGLGLEDTIYKMILAEGRKIKEKSSDDPFGDDSSRTFEKGVSL